MRINIFLKTSKKICGLCPIICSNKLPKEVGGQYMCIYFFLLMSKKVSLRLRSIVSSHWRQRRFVLMPSIVSSDLRQGKFLPL
jgi:hypothetical protein